MSVWEKLEKHLPSVQTPAQYIGGEWNSLRKDRAGIRTTVALVVPDSYKAGMTVREVQVLYGMLNREETLACERAFLPMPDLEERMRREGIPLFTLETHTPVRDFNVVLVCHLTPLRYPNVVAALSLAGIPLRSLERTFDHPRIIGTGPAAVHPEPVADFFDAIIVGDAEAAVPSLLARYEEFRKTGGRERREFLRLLAQKVPGIYVPEFYQVQYQSDGTIQSMGPEPGVPGRVRPASLDSLDEAYDPVSPVVPYIEVAHDRIQLEVMRGTRTRSVEGLVRTADAVYKNTGYDEMALLSPALADYPDLAELIARLQARFKARKVGVSLPSLRVSRNEPSMPSWIKLTDHNSITVDLGCGIEARRTAFGYAVTDEELFALSRTAFREGCGSIKLKFLAGWPGEQDEDIQTMVALSKKVSACGREAAGQEKDVTLIVSPFLPRPHTTFQWCAPVPVERIVEIGQVLTRLTKRTRIHLRFSDPHRDYLETALARGDRRMSAVLMAFHEMKKTVGGGEERPDLDSWKEAFARGGIDPQRYCGRAVPTTEVLPWDVIEAGPSREDLMREFTKISNAAKEVGACGAGR